jgi:hypothetical protein
MDYSKMKVTELSVICKNLKIKSSGSKADLIERLLAAPALPVEPQPYSYESYLKNLERAVDMIMSRPKKEELTYDLLDTPKSMAIKRAALKYRQHQMKLGIIWQFVFGNSESFEDLGVGHSTGLDILSVNRKLIGELKNRTNTDNASSRSANLDKLAAFKAANPDYTVFYGNVNDASEEATLRGSTKTIIHNGVEIVHYVGMDLFNLILGKKAAEIIEFVKKTMDKYIE